MFLVILANINNAYVDRVTHSINHPTIVTFVLVYLLRAHSDNIYGVPRNSNNVRLSYSISFVVLYRSSKEEN